MAQDKYVSNYVGTTIDALLKKINELDINSITTGITSNKSSIDKISTSVNSHQNSIKNINESINRLDEIATKTSDKVDQLNSTVSNSTNNIEACKKALWNTDSDDLFNIQIDVIERFSNDIKRISELIDSNNTDSSNGLDQISKDINNVYKLAQNNKQQIEAHSGSINDLGKDISSIGDTVSTIEDNYVNKAELENYSTTAQIEQQYAKITQLNNYLTTEAANQQFATMTTTNNLSDRINGLPTQDNYNDLNDQVSALSATVDDLQKQINELKNNPSE